MKQITKKALIEYIENEEKFAWKMLRLVERESEESPDDEKLKRYVTLWRTKWATYDRLIKVINGDEEVVA